MQEARERQPWEREWQAACARRDLRQGPLRLLRFLYDLAGDRRAIRVPWTGIVHELHRADATIRGWRSALDDLGIIAFTWQLGPNGGTSRSPGYDLISITLCPIDQWRPELAPAWARPGRADAAQQSLPFPSDLDAAEPASPSLQVFNADDEGGTSSREISRELGRANYLARDLARTFPAEAEGPSASEEAENEPAARAELPGEQGGQGAARTPSATSTTNVRNGTENGTYGFESEIWLELYNGYAVPAIRAVAPSDARQLGLDSRIWVDLMRLAAFTRARGWSAERFLEAADAVGRPSRSSRINLLKGIVARKCGFTEGLKDPEFFGEYDGIDVPVKFQRVPRPKRRPESAPNGEEPERE